MNGKVKTLNWGSTWTLWPIVSAQVLFMHKIITKQQYSWVINNAFVHVPENSVMTGMS